MPHAAFEPASSLLSRLAARGGASSMQRFCGDIAFPIDPLFRGEKVAIGQLAQLAGCDAAALEWVSVRHLGKGHFRLRDEFASLQSFQRLRVRVCPECVRAEAPSAAESWRVPRRLQWKFSSIRGCPEHGCMLVTLPPEKFSKDARDFSAQLRKHYGWVVDQPMIHAGHSPLEQYLTDRILKGRGDRWIDRLELNVVSRACEVLGLRIAVDAYHHRAHRGLEYATPVDTWNRLMALYGHIPRTMACLGSEMLGIWVGNAWQSVGSWNCNPGSRAAERPIRAPGQPARALSAGNPIAEYQDRTANVR
ncbi:TniQ family protein [Rhodovulum sp. MB263]|uniref:TniQ family protein n=1 Tax=Rhodovulum sp. (strain MB263) TaxID=308754 RepID=UPI0009B7447A|nr:TniQ family protein [Rhodovulum sp. MB263]ARC90532.1 hypothetical protein B5V46_11010 [Rhodovulum sp. MB263]